MLRLATGDEPYFKTLREVFGSTGPDSISTEEFRRRLEESSHQDLGWFFEDWVQRDGLPTIEVKTRVVPSKGGFTVEGQILQAPGDGFRRIVVPLVLEYADGGREIRLVFQERATTEFQLPILSPPARISVDPIHSTLARYR